MSSRSAEAWDRPSVGRACESWSWLEAFVSGDPSLLLQTPPRQGQLSLLAPISGALSLLAAPRSESPGLTASCFHHCLVIPWAFILTGPIPWVTTLTQPHISYAQRADHLSPKSLPTGRTALRALGPCIIF